MASGYIHICENYAVTILIYKPADNTRNTQLTLKIVKLGWYLGVPFVIPSYLISLSSGLYNPCGLNIPKDFGSGYKLKHLIKNDEYWIHSILLI